MIPCDDGYWTVTTGATRKDDCIPCKRGFFCTLTTMYNSNAFKEWRHSLGISDDTMKHSFTYDSILAMGPVGSFVFTDYYD